MSHMHISKQAAPSPPPSPPLPSQRAGSGKQAQVRKRSVAQAVHEFATTKWDSGSLGRLRPLFEAVSQVVAAFFSRDKLVKFFSSRMLDVAAVVLSLVSLVLAATYSGG